LWYIVPSFIEVQGEFYKHKEDAMRQFALFLVAALLVLLTGCDGDFPTESNSSGDMQPGTIAGKVHFDPEIQGTAANAIVELYGSGEAMNRGTPARTVLADDKGEFLFDRVCCGTYYLGVWKDNDGNGVISSGDYSFDRSSPEQYTCVVGGGCTVNQIVFATVVQ
jgi:hypothetical protein